MAKAQREKGKRGEREARDVLRAHGFDADRDGRLDDDLRHDVDGYHFEVKFRETLALPEWTRQAEADAGDRVPVVVYRRSRQPWRASLPFDRLAFLLSTQRALWMIALRSVDCDDETLGRYAREIIESVDVDAHVSP